MRAISWLREIHRALKPNGILGVEDHRAAPRTDPDKCTTTGYLPEAWVIAQVEAAGFKLVARCEINANPRDTRNHPKDAWTLPPELALGDVDRDKYLAIGESDRMTLKFVRVSDTAETRHVPGVRRPRPADGIPAEATRAVRDQRLLLRVER